MKEDREQNRALGMFCVGADGGKDEKYRDRWRWRIRRTKSKCRPRRKLLDG